MSIMNGAGQILRVLSLSFKTSDPKPRETLKNFADCHHGSIVSSSLQKLFVDPGETLTVVLKVPKNQTLEEEGHHAIEVRELSAVEL